MSAPDIIIALATPPGVAALALVRVSGAGTRALLARHVRRLPAPRSATHVRFCAADGALVDDVVLTLWHAPASYTGEDLAEISCHGNPLIVENILRALTVGGARLAGPGEFSRRAFLNGKLDLAQAEGLIDLIHARSERALRAARALQAGKLGALLLAAREQLLQVLAQLEAYIDFPDEDIAPDVGENFRARIARTRDTVRSLLASAREGQLLRQGLTVAISGAPNAGKSSLLNALLERDRAIVSATPGTTRDTIEEELMLAGVVVRLIDSAGLREGADAVERLGIARARQAIAGADLVLHLIDGSVAADEALTLTLPDGVPVITCLTKTDLPLKRTVDAALKISTVSGAGLAELKDAIVSALRLNETGATLDYLAISVRHEALLRAADAHLTAALDAITSGAAPEFISSDLRLALAACGQIVGTVTNEDVLDRVFQNFCLGK